MLWNVEGAKSILETGNADLSGIADIILVETKCLQELNIESSQCINQTATKKPRGRPMREKTIKVNKKNQVDINVRRSDHFLSLKLQFPELSFLFIVTNFLPRAVVNEKERRIRIYHPAYERPNSTLSRLQQPIK